MMKLLTLVFYLSLFACSARPAAEEPSFPSPRSGRVLPPLPSPSLPSLPPSSHNFRGVSPEGELGEVDELEGELDEVDEDGEDVLVDPFAEDLDVSFLNLLGGSDAPHARLQQEQFSRDFRLTSHQLAQELANSGEPGNRSHADLLRYLVDVFVVLFIVFVQSAVIFLLYIGYGYLSILSQRDARNFGEHGDVDARSPRPTDEQPFISHDGENPSTTDEERPAEQGLSDKAPILGNREEGRRLLTRGRDHLSHDSVV